MNRLTSANLADIIKKEKVDAGVAEAEDFESDDLVLTQQDISEIEETEKMQVIDVNLNDVNVEAVEIESINDHFGRLSDLIESLEVVTGLSVIPLEMGHIAPEVVSLSRHKIIEFNGVRYAMSPNVRMDVIEKWSERIRKQLSEGIPFMEKLNLSVTYNGVEYETLALSEAEWKYLMSMYRRYKQQLAKVNGNEIVLAILAERAD